MKISDSVLSRVPFVRDSATGKTDWIGVVLLALMLCIGVFTTTNLSACSGLMSPGSVDRIADQTKEKAILAAQEAEAREAAATAAAEAARTAAEAAKAEAARLTGERDAAAAAGQAAEAARLAEEVRVRELEQEAANLRAKASDAKAEAERLVAKANRDAAAKIDEVLSRVAIGEDGQIDAEKTAAGATNFLPFPWNLIAIGAIGIIGEVRTRRREQDAVSIIKSVDQIVASSPSTFKNMSLDTKMRVRSELTERAKSMIDAKSDT
jgi:hypothetical protein